jgi:hypothetical protein
MWQVSYLVRGSVDVDDCEAANHSGLLGLEKKGVACWKASVRVTIIE